MSKRTFHRRLAEAFTMFAVSAISLALLLYVGFAEGKRNYERIELDKLTAQGVLVQTAIENFLRNGLPLVQFPGFAALVAPFVDSQSELDAMGVYGQSGQRRFLFIDKLNPELPELSSKITQPRQNIEIEYGVTHYQVLIPLRNRFETVGTLVMMARTDFVTARLKASFLPLVFLAIGLAAVFAIVMSFAAPQIARSHVPWPQIGYGLTFLVMSVAVVYSLVVLYYDGVQGKIQTTTAAFSQRLNDIVAFDLSIKDFTGLDKAFEEYRRLTSDVGEASLIIDDTIRIGTDHAKVNKPWSPRPGDYELKVDLTRPENSSRVSIAVMVPRDVVLGQVARSVKNFAALFIASAFLAGLFLQVALSMQGAWSSSASSSDSSKQGLVGDHTLIILQPIFFLSVFLDSLTYAFLPKFMQDASVASGMSVGFAAMPFTAYYICFAASLIPAGYIADRYGPNLVIVSGLILAAASVFGLAMPLGIFELTGLRALSGAGQGMLLIGVQNYILAVASPERKTQGTAIIVLGFQGGMLSGMAIGSLLVSFIQPQGIYTISGAVGVAAVLYTLTLLPSLAERQQVTGGLSGAFRRIATDLKKVVTDGEFLMTMFCIGIPAKAILTGVITFALPLILIQQEYRAEDIGQIIMLYGLAVVASTSLVSRLVDRTRDTESFLLWGAVMSGIGLILVGLMGSYLLGDGLLSTTVAVIGVILVGIAHGFINAPVVTHVAQSALATKIGVTPATTTYRFLERGGHVAGPFLVSLLFIIWGQGPQVLAWIGIVTAAIGLLFVTHKFGPWSRPIQSEAAQ
jgi:MFS family permease